MIGSRMRKGDGMMRVIDIDDKGNVIIEKTSAIGKQKENRRNHLNGRRRFGYPRD